MDEWDSVIASAARLQQLVPDAVLVGGTASALHAHHRVSFDHVVADLRDRFDAVLEGLEATEGCVTARIERPVLILGNLDGVETGIRQLIRQRPLETEQFPSPTGDVTAPTLAECVRIKAWLVLVRNATRDYVDLAALTERLGADSVKALFSMDEYYADQRGVDEDRITTQLVKQLGQPAAYDFASDWALHRS